MDEFVKFASGKESTWLKKDKDNIPHFVYVLECENGKYYCGITSNLMRRLKEHTSGKGSVFTKKNKPEKLVYLEEVISNSEAINKETIISRQIKNEKFLPTISYKL
jgi:putative endonuclease